MEDENLLRTGRSAQPGKRGRSRLGANRRGSVTLLVAASLRRTGDETAAASRLGWDGAPRPT